MTDVDPMTVRKKNKRYIFIYVNNSLICKQVVRLTQGHLRSAMFL